MKPKEFVKRVGEYALGESTLQVDPAFAKTLLIMQKNYNVGYPSILKLVIKTSKDINLKNLCKQTIDQMNEASRIMGILLGDSLSTISESDIREFSELVPIILQAMQTITSKANEEQGLMNTLKGIETEIEPMLARMKNASDVFSKRTKAHEERKGGLGGWTKSVAGGFGEAGRIAGALGSGSLEAPTRYGGVIQQGLYGLLGPFAPILTFAGTGMWNVHKYFKEKKAKKRAMQMVTGDIAVQEAVMGQAPSERVDYSKKKADRSQLPDVSGAGTKSYGMESLMKHMTGGSTPEDTKQPRVRIAGTKEDLDPEIAKKLGLFGAVQAPETVKKSSATQAPEAAKQFLAVQAPETVKKSSVTQAPEAIKQSSVVQAPEVIKQPIASQAKGSLQTVIFGALIAFFTTEALRTPYTKRLLEAIEKNKGGGGGGGGGIGTGMLDKLLPALPMIGAAAAGIAGLGMGVWDAFKAQDKAKKDNWFGNKPGEELKTGQKVAAGVGGFLGGTGPGIFDKGSMGDKAKNVGWNAAKGAGIGAAIGTFMLPGIGTGIGAALGAGIGAVTGAIGGKKIAQAAQMVWKTTPFGMIQQGMESFKKIGLKGVQQNLQSAMTFGLVKPFAAKPAASTDIVSAVSKYPIKQKSDVKSDSQIAKHTKIESSEIESIKNESDNTAMNKHSDLLKQQLEVQRKMFSGQTDQQDISVSAQGGKVPYSSSDTLLEFIDGGFLEEAWV